jgi:aspartyl-tRNA(Asn)/glutamyl-tRNA(Gln) amidotransferase subunit B
LNENNWEIEQFPIASQGFGDFVQKTSSLAKDARLKLFEFMLENNVDAGTAMDKTGIKPMTDETVLREAVLAAIAANPKAVDDYKKGKVAAANSIKGYVMKNNKGAPNDVVQRLLEEELKK